MQKFNRTALFCGATLAVGLNGTAVAAQPAADTPTAESDGEIIVTAQKREERLRDVPAPVTAINSDQLLQNNQLLIRDYYDRVPGLSLSPRLQSQQNISIRGITTGPGNPTVGITIDDIPFGSSTVNGGGLTVPDFDPGDLSRIEVLRGPQGSLYGASSMGGLIKFVTQDPSTTDLSGRVQAGINAVHAGADPGYSIRGRINVPASDTLAISASGFYRRDAGYIDVPTRNAEDVNRADAHGGRLAVLWRPSTDFRINLGALFQNISGDGSSDVYQLPTLSGLEQNSIPNTGWYHRRVRLFSARAEANVGPLQFTSISAYSINSFADSFDFTFSIGPTALALFHVNGAALTADNETRKFSQEIRARTTIANAIDLLVGGFYTRESSDFEQRRLAIDPATGRVAGQLRFTSFPSTFEELAGFGAVTFRFSPRFDIQVGGRWSDITQTSVTTTTNTTAAGTTTTFAPRATARLDAFTYLVTPRFRPTEDVTLYARLASGYRAGGINVTLGTPPSYAPDTTKTYELGVKAELFNRLLYVDASAYYIDWDRIQVVVLVPISQGGGSFTTNVGRARSQGVEISTVLRPTSRLTISSWAAYSDAIIAEPFPVTSSIFAARGDRLPYAARWSGNVSVAQRFPIAPHIEGSIGGTMTYVGDRIGEFRNVALRQTLPAYTKIDLNAGITTTSNLSINLFITNLTDRRGALAGGLGYNPQYAFQYIQPRTIGLTIAKEF